MADHDDDTNELPELSNRDLLRLLMQEIADVRRELKEDIQNLDQKVTRIEHDVSALKKDVAQLKGTVDSIRLEMHQNFLMFMK